MSWKRGNRHIDERKQTPKPLENEELTEVSGGGLSGFQKPAICKCNKYGLRFLSPSLAPKMTCSCGGEIISYLNALLSSGGQKIIDEQREAYQEGAYRGFYPMADK